MRDVVDAIDPIGQARITETGMRGRNDAMALREQADESIVRREARAAVQKKQRRARAALMELELDSPSFSICRFTRASDSFSTHHYFIAWRSRQGWRGAMPEISVTSFWRIASAKLS